MMLPGINVVFPDLHDYYEKSRPCGVPVCILQDTVILFGLKSFLASAALLVKMKKSPSLFSILVQIFQTSIVPA